MTSSRAGAARPAATPPATSRPEGSKMATRTTPRRDRISSSRSCSSSVVRPARTLRRTASARVSAKMR